MFFLTGIVGIIEFFMGSTRLLIKLLFGIILVSIILFFVKWGVDIYHSNLVKKEERKQIREIAKKREQWVKDSTEYFQKRADSLYRNELFIPEITKMSQIEPLLNRDKIEVEQYLKQIGYKIIKNNENFCIIKKEGNLIEYWFNKNKCREIIINECFAKNLDEVDQYFLKQGYTRSFELGIQDPEIYESPEPFYIYSNKSNKSLANVYVEDAPMRTYADKSKIRIEIFPNQYIYENE